MKVIICRKKDGISIEATNITSMDDKKKIINALLNFPIKDPSFEQSENSLNKEAVPSVSVVEHDFDLITIS
jgi:hypothetical protein